MNKNKELTGDGCIRWTKKFTLGNLWLDAEPIADRTACTSLVPFESAKLNQGRTFVVIRNCSTSTSRSIVGIAFDT